MKRALAAVIAATATAFALTAGAAGATPGQYTTHGDVLVTVGVSGGCATVTWPRGTTTTLCDDIDQTTQEDIVPGNVFGAKITALTDGSVACLVTDVTSGDDVHSESSTGGTADCIRNAVEGTRA